MFKLVICFCVFLLGRNFSYAFDQISMVQYLDNDLQNEKLVCEPLDSNGQSVQCYFVNQFTKTLNPESDSSGAMQAQAINPNQGAFIKVELDQLITSVAPEKSNAVKLFNFYLKLHWWGQKQGMLTTEMDDRHIIKGQIVRQSNKDFEVLVTSVPDLYLLSTFMPRLAVAEIFGRRADTESRQLESDFKSWLKQLLTPVLKAYFEQSLIVTP